MTATAALPSGVPADIDLDALMADFDLDVTAPTSVEVGALTSLEDQIDELLAADVEVVAGEPVEETIEAAPEVQADPSDVSDALTAEDQELLAEIVAAEEPAAEHVELDETQERLLDAEIGRMEAYEAQDSEAAVSTEDEIEASPEAAAAPAKKARAPKAPKAPAAPRATKDLSTLAPEHFSLRTDDVPADDGYKAIVLAKRPKQVKIAEKFDNVLGSLAAGRKPSTYVMDCFEVLDARKEVTNGDLVAALQAHDYSVGTSRSQAGQIMELFGVLEIADRTGQKLTLRADSTIAAKLRALGA